MGVVKGALVSILLLVIACVLLWFVITQPFVANLQPRIDVRVSPKQLQDHVRKLSDEFPPRGDDTDALDVTANYIYNEFAKYGRAEQMEYSVWGIPYRNISIRFGPDTVQRIVIGAHYDTHEGLPGADDNASGVAGLIELARLLRDAPLRYQVELVAYTLEELPYFRTKDMGSAVHAGRLKEQGTEVILMISLEMIGYFSDEENSQDYPLSWLSHFYPTVGNYIAVVGNLSGTGEVRRVKSAMKGATTLPVYSINAPRVIPGIDWSDHLSFWRHGFPAVMVTDTAFYRNTAYHTEYDTWNRLDYPRMAQVVEGVHGVVMAFAGTEALPESTDASNRNK